jgi:hypothetical protein
MVVKQRIQFCKGISHDLPKGNKYRGRTPGFEIMQERSDNNPPKDLADHKGSDVSNNTQPEVERMQRHRIIEHLNNLMLR